MNSLFKRIIRKILVTYQSKVRGLFTSTNIETYGYCNRKCSFCFNSDSFPDREVGIMDENLYYKIIDELSDLGFAGRISPHFYGEPLLDTRLVNLISYARKKCPYAYIRFSSNGDLLTEELLLKLLENGLDMILITNYDDYEKDNLINLSQKYHNYVIYRNFRSMNMVNRAGELFERNNENINKSCLRPSNQLVINWKGNVLLCCNDYYEKHVFGNVKNESIMKIWNSDAFKKYRKRLSKEGGRGEIDICRNCDM